MIILNKPSAKDAGDEILGATSLNDFAIRWEHARRDIPSAFEQKFSSAVVDYLATIGRPLDDFLNSLPT